MSSDDLETEKLSGRSADAVRSHLRPPPSTCLLVQWRDGSVVVPLASGAGVVIGRSAPSDVIVPDVSLSRQHARFEGTTTGASIEDLASTNGTTVRGGAVEQAELVHGDEAVLGGVSVTVLSATSLDARDIAPHERFRGLLEDEIARARFFKRGLCVFMVRFADHRGAPRDLLRVLRAFLRPIDRVGQYATGVLEVIAPEQSAKDVRDRLVAALRTTPAGEAYVAGVAGYPESGTSAEELLGGAWECLRRASSAEPVASAAEEGRTGVRSPRSAPPRPGARSKRMVEVLATAARVAKSPVPVLILGETGTGKEVLARTVHDASPRRNGPFLCVNCGAIPAPLVESILFGHERGAFTGAAQRTQGVFEAADGGTVFFDEIGELPTSVQAVLLRVLETKSFTRVGATRETSVDTRIVAATNRDLELMVDAGTFRQDLLYRLNAVTLELPPLRERREDIPELARDLLAHAAAGMDPAPVLDPDVMEILEAYAWPGNIRELRNVLERAVAVTETTQITLDDLPERLRSIRISRLADAPVAAEATVIDLAKMTGDYWASMESLEAELLRFALQREGWNQTHTARRLGMSLRTLVHKIKVLGVRRPPKP